MSLDRFMNQVYSDSTGEYRVWDILQYIISMNIEPQLLEVADLVYLNLQRSPYEVADEVPGSPEFVKRAENTDLRYPIIAVQYPDGIFIVDGIHRLWKAAVTGVENLSTFLLTPEDLNNIPHQPPAQMSEDSRFTNVISSIKLANQLLAVAKQLAS